MRFLITGANGQLGSDLMEILTQSPTHEAVGLDLPVLDITDEDNVAKEIAWANPDVVVNCAAWTAVDLAEEREQDAWRVNALGPEVIAKACALRGITLVQISTDYVFDGSATAPYSEDSEPNPNSAYGRTKRDGEVAVLKYNPDHSYIVRTAWLYGINGSNFVKTMLKLERERDTVSVVTDQVGQPTWSRDLANQIILMLEQNAPAGIYHGTNSGETSWFDFARAVFEDAGVDPSRVLPTTSAEFVRPAPRPAYSVLGHRRWAQAHLSPMRDWREALHEAMRAGIAHVDESVDK